MIDLDLILKATEGQLISGQSKYEFSGISTDSRRIKDNELFIALIGDNFDGYEYIDEAFTKGAMGAIVEKTINKQYSDKIIIQVKSTLRSLGDIAQSWRNTFRDLKIAAITGSNGKTTTKEIAWNILSLKFNTLKNTGNINNLIGLPLTLLKINNKHQAAVVELGMNDFGEIRRLEEIAKPNIAAITNIGKAHLEKLKNLQGVAKAKGELVEKLNEDDTFVVNNDDPYIKKISEKVNCNIINFATESEDSLISAHDIEFFDYSSIKFKLRIGDHTRSVILNSIGKHNVMNALCSAGISYAFGCDIEDISAGIEKFKPSKMRLEIIESPQGFKIINDTYNANPNSMINGIEELVRLRGNGKCFAVLGDMLELGTYSEEEHEKLGRFISCNDIDFVVLYGKYSEFTSKGINGKSINKIAKTHSEASEFIRSNANAGDVVLIKGSRGMKMERVINNLFEE